MNARILMALIVLFFGCAAPAPKKTAPPQVKSSKIAAAVILENKSISYYEDVYKVLYIEKRHQKASFDGLWDVDNDLSNILSNELAKLNLDVRPVKSVLKESDEYSTFVQSVLETRVAEFGLKDLDLKESTIKPLVQKGISYLLLFRINCFSVSDINRLHHFATVEMPTHLVVYNLDSRKEEYRQSVYMRGALDYGDSPKNIESDNLSLLKMFAHLQIKDAAINQVPEHLGIKRSIPPGFK